MQKWPNPILGRGDTWAEKTKPNLRTGGPVSKKDQTDFPLQAKKDQAESQL